MTGVAVVHTVEGKIRGGRGAFKGHEAVVEEAVVEEAVAEEAVAEEAVVEEAVVAVITTPPSGGSLF